MVDTDFLESHLGPVDFVAVEIAPGAQVAEGFGRLLDLVDRQVIRVLDLEFVVKHADGSVGAVDPGEVTVETDFDFGVFAGASSGVLDGEDLAGIGALLAPNGVAAVLVYEELSLMPMLASLEAGGARLLVEGTVDVDDLDAALTVDSQREERT